MPRRGLLIGLVVLLAVGAWIVLPGGDESSPATRAPRRADRRGGRQTTLPDVGLARLDAPRPRAEVGRRDLFDFGRAPVQMPPEAEVEAAPAAATPAPTAASLRAASAALGARGRAAAANLSLRYIGNARAEKGEPAAVLLTEDDEVVAGQVGELVANQFKIVAIGLESVDVQGVGSDRVQRIPLERGKE
jgi:hypothetical protein